MEDMSTLHKDYLASGLRSQVGTLCQLLDSIENKHDAEYGYALESLRRVESDLRKIRNFLEV